MIEKLTALVKEGARVPEDMLNFFMFAEQISKEYEDLRGEIEDMNFQLILKTYSLTIFSRI